MFGLHKPRTAEAPACATETRPADRRSASPRVDIHEGADAVHLMADMPGVTADGLDISVHGDVLTLRGRSRAQEPEKAHAIWREYAIRDYERSFRLGHAIDSGRITAAVKDGVVRITLPKTALAQPKRITVTTG
jgi:HSP20 family protein